MARKPSVANKRLANKVIWALEDIIAACHTLREAVRVTRLRAEQLQDVLILARLGEISDQIALIEGRARAARRGEYDGYDSD